MTDGSPSSTPATGRVDEVERARQEMRTWILNGELRAGQPISQVQVASRLGVSRGPLREALRLLQREGFVHQEHNHRARVADFSVTDLDELYAMRVCLESMAVALATPLMTASDLAELDELLLQMDRLARQGDLAGWGEPHRQFHAALVRPAGERLARECAHLSDHSERYRRVFIAQQPRVWATGAGEHQAIVDAVRAGDQDLAAARIAEHLARTAVVVVGTMDPGYEPVAVRRALRTNVPQRDRAMVRSS
jgi:DNA-binding GntR family transcriptional regulator